MAVWKSLSIVVATSVATAGIVFSLASAPGGERLGVGLSLAAHYWAEEPFDQALERELDQLMYPHTRELMTRLVMMQVAEQARVARLNAITRADMRGWQVPLPGIGGQPFRTHPGEAPSHYQQRALQADLAASNSNNKVLTTLVCFLFALGFAFARIR